MVRHRTLRMTRSHIRDAAVFRRTKGSDAHSILRTRSTLIGTRGTLMDTLIGCQVTKLRLHHSLSILGIASRKLLLRWRRSKGVGGGVFVSLTKIMLLTTLICFFAHGGDAMRRIPLCRIGHKPLSVAIATANAVRDHRSRMMGSRTHKQGAVL